MIMYDIIPMPYVVPCVHLQSSSNFPWNGSGVSMYIPFSSPSDRGIIISAYMNIIRVIMPWIKLIVSNLLFLLVFGMFFVFVFNLY